MVAATAIPTELISLPNWVVWNYEQRNSRRTKVPKQPRHPSMNASVVEPDTWADFYTALRVVEWGLADGIGLVLTPDLGLVAWDFDHCRLPDGSWDATVVEMVRELDSYTEVTPSGEGLRVLCYGKLPQDGRRKGNIECYAGKRFITVTGNHLDGTPDTIEHRQFAIDALYERVFGATTPAAGVSANAPVLNLSDAELIRRAMNAKDGEKFRLLWEGDSAGYPSDSEADLALASMLLFWTGGDTEHVERLFTQSARGQREKWRTRPDYRRLTLQAARNGKSDFYHPTKNGGNGHNEIEIEPEKTYRHMMHLRELFAGRFRWCPEWKTWLRWTDIVWQRTPQESVVATATEELRRFYSERVANAATHTDAEKWTKRLLDLFTTDHVADAVELLRGYDGFLTHAGEFDADPYVLNCLNGILDLRTLELHPHHPDALCTRVVNASYDPTATAPQWGQFLGEIFAGDADLIGFVQRACGMALIGENRHHLLFILHGTGANGKSTFLHALRHVFGSYGGSIPRDALLARKHQQDAQRTAYAALVGLRLTTLEELSDDVTLSVVAVKDITSGNVMQVRALYENYREVRLGLTPFVAVNTKPLVTEHTEGTWRRLRLVPFTVTIPEGKRDPELRYKLEREADGIFTWLVNGLRQYWTHGLQEPAAVVEATRAYRSEQDVLEGFLSECCEFDPRATTPTQELYEAYRAWALEQGENEAELLNEKAFGRRLTKRGIATARSGDGKQRLRRGIRLKTHARTDVSDMSDVSTEKSPREADFGEVSGNNVRNVRNVRPVDVPDYRHDVIELSIGTAAWCEHCDCLTLYEPQPDGSSRCVGCGGARHFATSGDDP
ncbi:MAG: phage/plasmid primase, P4 family [Armatimonadota bacterium]